MLIGQIVDEIRNQERNMETRTMAIDINKDVNLDEDALEQVKGGGAVKSPKPTAKIVEEHTGM